MHSPLDNRLPNGNDSGIGIVIRDRKGTIIRMYSGTIRNLTRRANEFWALLVGLKGAFLENEECVELEFDNWEAIKEWDKYKWFHDPNHANMIQQLNQRKETLISPWWSGQSTAARMHWLAIWLR